MPLILVSGNLDRDTFVHFSLGRSTLTVDQVQALLNESSDIHDLEAAFLVAVADKTTDHSLHDLISMNVKELETWHQGLKGSPVQYLLDPLFDRPNHEIARLQSDLRHSGWHDLILTHSTEQLEEALTSLFREVLNRLELRVIEATPALTP